MKKIILLLLVLVSVSLFSQKKQILDKPKVDERVELLSIVFRLAEAQEYNSEYFKLYTDKIGKHFSEYKNHELIQFVKKIRKENGVSYDAVMSMAIHLGGAPNFNPLVQLSDTTPEKRWGKENAIKFVELLQKFYQDAHCSEFFKENSELYKNVSARFIPVYNHLDLKWYRQFYGKEPRERFKIINGLGIGGGNYGPNITLKNGDREVYAIMGTWSMDSTGMPKFNLNNYLPTLLHEFNHSFVNYLVDKNAHSLQASGEKIYAIETEAMKRQAYGNWETMVKESLVRAAVIKYMKDHQFDKIQIENEVKEQFSRKFLWINKLTEELENYDKQRDKYPTFESYMPNIIKAFTAYADSIEIFEKKYEEKRPKVLSISEFRNSDKNIDAEIKTITINFDRPLLDRGFSIVIGNLGETAFPKVKDEKYSDDKKTVILQVTLEKDKDYQFILSGKHFISDEGIPIKDYEINFRTK